MEIQLRLVFINEMTLSFGKIHSYERLYKQ